MSIEVHSDDVVTICGKRRSGKSYFLEALIKGFKRRIIYDINWEHDNLGFVVHSNKVMVEMWQKGITHIVFQPSSLSEESFNEFVRTVRTLPDLCLIVEEIEKYATPHHMPNHLKDLIDRDRHRGRGLICTVRRLSELNASISGNSDSIFVFRTHRPQDLDLLRRWIGEEIYKIRDAPEYSFIHYDDREGTTTLMQKIT